MSNLSFTVSLDATASVHDDGPLKIRHFAEHVAQIPNVDPLFFNVLQMANCLHIHNQRRN